MGMRRRGVAAAIIARIKEGLGSEAPLPPSCTGGLARHRRAEHTYGVWVHACKALKAYRGGKGGI